MAPGRPVGTVERPKRIQRKRTKGWRMPEGAVYVGRPSRWGNRVTMADLRTAIPGDHVDIRAVAAGAFRKWAEWKVEREGPDWLAPLRGRDLACWCPLGQPCHADVLLELANA